MTYTFGVSNRVVLAVIPIGGLVLWGNPTNVLHQTALNSA